MIISIHLIEILLNLITAHQFLRFGRRRLTISLKYGILTAEEKNSTRGICGLTFVL